MNDALREWTRTVNLSSNAYEDRQQLRAVLEAAGLDVDREILDVWAPAAEAGFVAGLAYAYCALNGGAR